MMYRPIGDDAQVAALTQCMTSLQQQTVASVEAYKKGRNTGLLYGAGLTVLGLLLLSGMTAKGQ